MSENSFREQPHIDSDCQLVRSISFERKKRELTRFDCQACGSCILLAADVLGPGQTVQQAALDTCPMRARFPAVDAAPAVVQPAAG